MIQDLKSIISDHQRCINKILDDPTLLSLVQESITLITQAFKQNKKVLICGNGGSASDAEHLAAELSGKLKIDRPPLNAEALHVNTAALTAIANDYNYESIFSRIVEAKGHQDDILIALTTSGRSQNVLAAIETAKSKGLKVLLITGTDGRSNNSDIHIKIPSTITERIQEAYMLLGHIICEKVESNLFS